MTVQGPVKEQQPDGMSHGGAGRLPGPLLTTQHHWGVGGREGGSHTTHPPPLDPPSPPFKKIGPKFLQTFGQSKLFSGAFGANRFRPKIFLGAFGASKNSAPPEMEGGGGVGPPPNAWSRAPGPRAHRNTARQAMDGLWTEVCGQQKQSNDPGNNQHALNTPTTGRH